MKCFICGVKLDGGEEELIKHIEEVHPDALEPDKVHPEGRTAKQLVYHDKNKYKIENIGVCSCGKDKPWNEEKGKYEHFCGTEEHNRKLRQEFENNMETTYGTKNPAELPEHQVAMMSGRKIARRFKLGKKEFVVLSSVEEGMIREAYKYGVKEDDMEAPSLSVNVPYEMPPDYKKRNHIPDLLIISKHTLMSGKDSIDNPNMHPNMKKDRFKSLYEYQAILNDTDYNFVQIEGNEDVRNVPLYLKAIDKANAKKSRYVIPPKVDCFVLMQESINSETLPDDLFLNKLVLNEQGYILTNDSLNGKGFILSEEHVFFTDIQNWNSLFIDVSEVMKYDEYFGEFKIGIWDHENIKRFLESKVLLDGEIITECVKEMIE